MNSIGEYAVPELKGHLERIQTYTGLLLRAHAKRLGLKMESGYIGQVVASSALHDIGKAAIPPEILFKADKLTLSERLIMQTHPRIGAYMVDKHKASLSMPHGIAKSIVLHHHERYDGAGYPESLEGKSIPFEARVVAVADVYDALTSKRCYKEAWSRNEALGFIKEQKGAHFDPEIADSFLSLETELAQITSD